MSIDGLDPAILGPAFAAGLLVLATHVPLGRQVLNRGIIFIDLAIAQIAGLGVIAAHATGWGESELAVQLTAYATALTGALILHGCERRWPDIQEALIGSSFIVAASAGILLLTNNPHAGEHLKDLLVGQILWVDYHQLDHVAVLYAVVLLLWTLLAEQQRNLMFYVLFALTVTASVQLVGVYLVFASLIIPALAVRNGGKHATWYAYGLGVAGYAIGLLLSALLDLPSGAVIVLTLAALAILASFLAPSSTERSV